MSQDITFNAENEPVAMEITFHEDEAGELIFKSSVVRLPTGRMRLSPNTRMSLAEVFEPEALVAIKELCDTLENDNQVVSFLDREVIIGLSVGSGISILSHRLDQGVRQIMLKVRNVFGNPWALFHPSFLAMNGHQSLGDIRLDRIAQRLFRPIRDLRFLIGNREAPETKPMPQKKIMEIAALVDMQSRMFSDLVAEMLEEAGLSSKGTIGTATPRINSLSVQDRA